jgi:hypothetical protein
MPAPRNYVRGYSFAGYQATNPNRPLPGPSLDNELEEIEQSLTETISGLNDIRRADGQLRNGIVGRDALAPDLSTGVRPATLWQAGIQYQVQDTVSYLASFYRCTIAHLSTDFLTDLTATRWELYADIGTTATDAQIARNEAVAARNEAVPAGAAATAGSNNVTALYDLFDDRYLGEKTVLPSVDNDGNALVNGALVSLTGQTPTTLNGMYVRRSGAWQSVLSQFLGAFVAYRYVATASQTVFTGADANSVTLSYVPNAVFVTVNGVSQTPNTYTATNGTSVVLGTALTAGDVVVIYSFGSFSVGDIESSINDLITGSVYHTDIGAGDPRRRSYAGRTFWGAYAGHTATFNSQASNPKLTAEEIVLHSWATRDSEMAVSSKIGSMAVVGSSQASRRSALGGWPALPSFTPAAIGVSGFAINDVTTGTLGAAWGGYSDAVRWPGAGFTVGHEIAVANLGANVTSTPYNLKVSGGLTASAWLQSGCGLDAVSYAGTYGAVGNITAYIAMLSSFTTGTIASRPKALSGIIVTEDALVDLGGQVYEFAALPQRSQIRWYRPDNTVAGYVWFGGTAGSGITGIDILNGQVNINATTGLQATELHVVDSNFRMQVSSGQPTILVDTGDYWTYDRVNNGMDFFIGSTKRFSINPFVTDVAGGLAVGGNVAIAGRVAGWGVPTGTLTRTTFATSTVTLAQLAERVAALISDLHATSATNVRLISA